MPKVTIIQVVYNNRRFIEPVFSAIFNQTNNDFNVVAVISGNDDGGKELLTEKFPQVEIIDPGYNIGFAAGHNLVFSKYQSEFFQLVNPDMIMEPNYVEQMLKAFNDPKAGAATGKLYQCKFENVGTGLKSVPTKVIDSTGVTISKSGRARDRGQHEVDDGQYDDKIIVDAVSGAGCMYRRSALESVKIPLSHTPVHGRWEYFDEDFHSYWEDVDLSWRMKNAAWKNVFVPLAIGYHGRGAGSSVGGYLDIAGFIKHHRTLPPRVRQLNYQNHLLMYIKNSRWFYPQFFIREFVMFFYILFFEPGTLKIVPQIFKLLPKIISKRWVLKKLHA